LGYRYLQAEADWDAWSPYPTTGGRFDVDEVPTLYLAQSPEGAVAEYLHRHPEFIGMELSLVLRVWELAIDLMDNALDVRDAPAQASVGISLDRLNSQDADSSARYAECRVLAGLAINANLVGIAYPSAAAAWPKAWNLVLFGASDPSRWSAIGVQTVSPPILQNNDVRQLDSV
jgi:RES domain-containing protein